MRLITSTALAAGLLSAALLGGCEMTSSGMEDDATEEAASAGDAGDAGAEAAADPQDGAAEAHDGYPPMVMEALMKSSACRDISEQPGDSVRDQWDAAGCATVNAELDAARAAHADDAEAVAAIDDAWRPTGE